MRGIVLRVLALKAARSASAKVADRAVPTTQFLLMVLSIKTLSYSSDIFQALMSARRLLGDSDLSIHHQLPRRALHIQTPDVSSETWETPTYHQLPCRALHIEYRLYALLLHLSGCRSPLPCLQHRPRQVIFRNQLHPIKILSYFGACCVWHGA